MAEKLPPGEKRNARAVLHCTKEQKARIDSRATTLGMSTSDYLLKCATDEMGLTQGQ